MLKRAGMIASLAAAMSILSFTAQAADNAPDARVTFTKDVLPIFQQNCQVCHRPGGQNSGGMIAPMSFMTYQEVRPWAKAITRAVQERNMPPWFASPATHGVFLNERTLTEAQIDTIAKWVATGAPQGRAEDAPEPRVFPATDWAIGEPDLILTMPEPYWVKDDLFDLNTRFTTKVPLEMLSEDRWIKAIEFKGGSEAVHHMIGYVVPQNAEGVGTLRGWMVGGIAPGDNPDRYPEGYGMLFPAGADFMFNMHYHKEPGPGTGMWDVSRVGIKFYPKDAEVKPIHIGNASNGGFELPAGHPNWAVGAARVFTEDVRLITLMPHMHLRGKDAKYTAFYPDGTSEVLLEVPRYRFDWQTTYMFREPKRLPAGTRIEVLSHFDNSTENQFNPDAASNVTFGSSTTDEMMIGWMSWVDEEGESAEQFAATAEPRRR